MANTARNNQDPVFPTDCADGIPLLAYTAIHLPNDMLVSFLNREGMFSDVLPRQLAVARVEAAKILLEEVRKNLGR